MKVLNVRVSKIKVDIARCFYRLEILWGVAFDPRLLRTNHIGDNLQIRAKRMAILEVKCPNCG